MVYIYSPEEIAILREGGSKLEQIMRDLEAFSIAGVRVDEMNQKALELIENAGATPATVGYTPAGASYAFPAAVCVSLNNEVAHGISSEDNRELKEGDIVSADIVIGYKGLYVDTCRSWGVGEMSEEDQKLIDAARATTDAAVAAAMPGSTTDAIGAASAAKAKEYGFNTVRDLGGHGVGKEIHMDPFVPNYSGSGYSTPLRPGMVLAIEPILNAGGWEVDLHSNEYLFTTRDGKKSAQFEETVLITESGPEILTKID